MKKLLAVLLLLPGLFWGTSRLVKSIIFTRNCEGYLKRAADANTVFQASKELNIAIEHMENNGLTEGYTSILYTTPDEDIEFWYNNIKSALTELQKVTEETTSLEKSNLLMKLRETLLDASGQDGKMVVTIPEGISVYPYNILFCCLGVFSIVCLITSIRLWIIILDR